MRPKRPRYPLYEVVTDVDWLEEALISEIRVVAGLYECGREAPPLAPGGAPVPPDAVLHYIESWGSGRRQAWREVRQLARRLRRVAGDSPDEWNARLTRLEIAGNVEMREAFATTQQSTLV